MPSVTVRVGPGALTVGVALPDTMDPARVDYSVSYEVPVPDPKLADQCIRETLQLTSPPPSGSSCAALKTWTTAFESAGNAH